MFFLQQFFVPIFLSAVMFLLALIGLGHFLAKHNPPRTPADAALVFGTGLAWKAKERWTHAASLFHKGQVRHIIVSGGVIVPGLGLTEAEWFRDRLIQLGVPSDSIFMENKAANAAENVEFSLPIIQEHGFRSVVLVMSDFTGIRAHLTAKRAWAGKGIKIHDHHAPSPAHWNPWTWWLFKEGRHLTRYVVTRLFRYRLLSYLWQRE